jgi:hypothetical protein
MNVKGSALRSTMNYLREHFSDEQVRRVLAKLPPAHQDIVEKPILISKWFDSDILTTLMRTMSAELGQPSEILFHRLGRQSCDDGLNTVYRIFFKIGSPSYLLKFVAQVWRNYYSDGKMEVVSRTDSSVHIRLLECAFPDPGMCLRLSGWMERSLEISGAKNINFSHCSCVHLGGASCEWKASWE